ncbi:MAG: hypothetical protein OEM52_07585, partial [bacterium]|nr:hypothetical protein [bacterium]
WLFSWMSAQTALREVVVKIMKILPAAIQQKAARDALMLLDPGGAMALALTHPLLTVPILLWAILIPVRHLAGEQERGLLDVILAKPFTRLQWIAALVLWQVGGLLVLSLAVGASFARAIGHFPPLENVNGWSLLYMTLAQAAWGFAIGGFTAIIAARWGRFRLTLGVAIAFVLTNLLWEVICRTIGTLKPYIVLSLWHWSEPRSLYLVRESTVINWLVLLGFGLVSWLVALRIFQRHDLGAK